MCASPHSGAAPRPEIHAAREVLKGRAAAEEHCGEATEGDSVRLRLRSQLGPTPVGPSHAKTFDAPSGL
jgi:hypothetical protein